MMADLKMSGTEPVSREVLMMSVMKGKSFVRPSEKREAGRGSSSQVLRDMDFKVFRTSS